MRLRRRRVLRDGRVGNRVRAGAAPERRTRLVETLSRFFVLGVSVVVVWSSVARRNVRGAFSTRLVNKKRREEKFGRCARDVSDSGRTEPDCTEGLPEDMPLILTSQYLRFAGAGDEGQARGAGRGRGGGGRDSARPSRLGRRIAPTEAIRGTRHALVHEEGTAHVDRLDVAHRARSSFRGRLADAGRGRVPRRMRRARDEAGTNSRKRNA